MLALIDDETVTPLGATTRQNAAAAFGGHPLEESVFVKPFTLTGLISPLHDRFSIPVRAGGPSPPTRIIVRQDAGTSPPVEAQTNTIPCDVFKVKHNWPICRSNELGPENRQVKQADPAISLNVARRFA